MRVAYLDCFSGVSGDMMLGALLHAGVDLDLFRQTIAALGVDAQIKIETVNRSGISSTRVRVLTAEGGQDDVHVVLDEHPHSHGHSDDAHTHSHSHSHSNDHSHHGTETEKGKKQHKHHGNDHHQHTHEHGRSLKEIHELISHAPIDSAARAIALRAFRLLGEAEAKIHNIPVEQIHFHDADLVEVDLFHGNVMDFG